MSVRRPLSVSSIVDVFVRRGTERNAVDLNAICGGAFDNNLEIIPDGTVVTLRRGSISRRVVVREQLGSECVANSLIISTALARQFGLRDRTRFLLTYNTKTKTLTMRRKRVTIDTWLLDASRALRANRVAIGLGLALKIGNYLRSGQTITLRHGHTSLKLRMVRLTRDFVFNTHFRLNPDVIRLLGLAADKRYFMAYHQSKRELVFLQQMSI